MKREKDNPTSGFQLSIPKLKETEAEHEYHVALTRMWYVPMVLVFKPPSVYTYFD